MAYRVNALFNDGCLLVTDIDHRPTPKLRDRIFVRRGGRVIEGFVTDIKKCPVLFLNRPDEIIDEVHFCEIGANVFVGFPSHAPNRKPLQQRRAREEKH